MLLNNLLQIKRIKKGLCKASYTYKNYIFRYKDEYKLDLSVGFDIEAFTESLIPVFNFGYGLGITKLNNRKDRFEYLEDVDDSSGISTKRYFEDKESRNIINKFVQRALFKDIKKYNFPIIVRGPLTEFKQNSPRYLKIDSIITSMGYIRTIVPFSSMNNHIPHEHASLDSEKDQYWFYTKSRVPEYELCNLLPN